MRRSQPVARVVDLLTNFGYFLRVEPVTIGSVTFEFAAVLLGSSHANDLIVVVDTLVDTEARIRQKIEGLSRALDLVCSRRSLTVVLVGPLPRPLITEALARVSRVLMVGTPTGENAERLLVDTLAVLLPLTLPNASEAITDPLEEVRKHLTADVDKLALAKLLKAAMMSTSEVEIALCSILEAPLKIFPESLAP